MAATRTVIGFSIRRKTTKIVTSFPDNNIALPKQKLHAAGRIISNIKISEAQIRR